MGIVSSENNKKLLFVGQGMGEGEGRKREFERRNGGQCSCCLWSAKMLIRDIT